MYHDAVVHQSGSGVQAGSTSLQGEGTPVGPLYGDQGLRSSQWAHHVGAPLAQHTGAKAHHPNDLVLSKIQCQQV